MRILITGAGGFAGSHLAEYLRAQPAADVWGVDRGGTREADYLPPQHALVADLRDPAETRAVIRTVQPERIFHLAGQAFVGDSWADPWATLETNLRAQVNLCEAVLAEGLRPRILALGSMEEYGRVAAADLPIRETQPLRPDSPYGVSKVGQDLLGLQYFLSRGLPVVRVRPFNHIGPRQNPKFVAPAFASQIAAIEAGRQPPVLRVGNLSARRDFTDVRDMVRAYGLALEHGEPGEVYNLGSGRSRSIQELLDVLLGLAACPITVEVDQARLRPSDLPDVVCDGTAFRARTGWEPRLPFEQSLRDLLDYERSRLAAMGEGGPGTNAGRG
ncbi:MAG: GDP-mannose 4,6-dehydratase [Anaerolineales bacterium]|nr:GDP-mannose 4,6-dehydratase [Anaerolineales bacterium]